MDQIIIKKHQVISDHLPKGIEYVGHQLKIKSNHVFKNPIKVTLIDDNNDTLELIVGKNSEVKLILEIQSEETSNNQYKITLIAEDNSKVNYLLVSDLKSKNALLEHYYVAHRDSKLTLLGGFVSNVLNAKMDVELIGEGAEVSMRAVAISSDEHKQYVDVLIKHKAPNTFGDMTNIGIVNKKGLVVLNGVEKIEKGMKNANAFQTLKGIITSDDAIMEVNPILLIDEYDVKAGHGATIGKIEEEVLFYLRSRGLTKAEAERLVIFGFLQPIIDEIVDEPLKERFIHLVNMRI